MSSKIYLYIGIALFVLILIGSFIIGTGATKNNQKTNLDSKPDNPELNKYRSEDIPEDCRLPEYENDVHYWKEHLSHHKQTQYCLDYYKDV